MLIRSRSVAFISIIRIVYLNDLHVKSDPDFAWFGARFGYLSLIEINAAISVASLITLKPLAHRIAPKLFGRGTPAGMVGNTPPTIGTDETTRQGKQVRQDHESDKVELEEWDGVPRDQHDASASVSSTRDLV